VTAWYERDFAVPDEWRESRHPVQLTFGACGYETRVWLNGMPLRTNEGEDVHLGEYTSFSYELPDELLRDVNRLTVRVTDSLDPDRPRGKQESHVYKRGGIWYQAISGPVRSIWLEPIERNRLRSRLSVVSDVAEGLVEFGITTRVRDPGTYRLRLAIAALDEDEPCATSDVELPLEPGEQRQHLVVQIPNARSWSPAAPALYRVVAQLRGPDGHVSQIETRFGLREFSARGRWLYLNGERLYLDGILYQPGTATFDQMRRHLFAMRELGCNLVRVHITGIDPRIYALADEIGVLLWIEVPSPHRSSRESRAAHWAELQRMLIHVAAQPSIVLLSLYNESWGAEDIGTNEETRAYVRRVGAFLRTNYPQFLIVDNDGWQHVSTEGRLESDLLTAHVYRTEVDAWQDVLDRVAAGDPEAPTALPLVVGDPYFYAGQAPVVISEWGGFGFSLYGGPEEPGERGGRIRAFKAALRERPIAGDVYTQATSIEQEDNGLIDPASSALLVPRGLLDTQGSA
jgi:beta-galactosidase/beta-glucuronidase